MGSGTRLGGSEKTDVSEDVRLFVCNCKWFYWVSFSSLLCKVGRREAMAAAAEKRAQAFNQGGGASKVKQNALAERRKKDELVGKIQAQYQAKGKEAPIGLPSCSIAQLKKHLDTVKQSK
jgi:hypothetical protein